MLYSKPCCPQLNEALTEGDQRMFDLVGEPDSVLMLATSYTREEHEGQMARVWRHAPVYFCPFCGTRLQTPEAVERWQSQNLE